MTPSTDPLSLPALLQYGAALLIILLLIGGLIYTLRRVGGVGGLGYGRGRRRRLALIETLPIDNRRRLLLVRRDDVEHLILLGQPGDILIEQGREPVDAEAGIEIERRSEPRLTAAFEPPLTAPSAASPAAPTPAAPTPAAPTPIAAAPAVAAAPQHPSEP